MWMSMPVPPVPPVLATTDRLAPRNALQDKPDRHHGLKHTFIACIPSEPHEADFGSLVRTRLRRSVRLNLNNLRRDLNVWRLGNFCCAWEDCQYAVHPERE